MSTEDKKMQWALEPTTGTDTESGQVKQISVPEKGDVGLELLAQAGPVDYTEEEAQQKIDMCLLPIVSAKDPLLMLLANTRLACHHFRPPISGQGYCQLCGGIWHAQGSWPSWTRLLLGDINLLFWIPRCTSACILPAWSLPYPALC